MMDKFFHNAEVSAETREKFLSSLIPISDFSKVETGTRIYSKQSINPLMYDLFEKECMWLDRPSIEYRNPNNNMYYKTSPNGYYFWDEEKAIEIMKDSTYSNGRTLFINAILHDKKSIIEYFLKHNLHLETKDDQKRSPFFHAASVGNLDVCKQLVEKGAEIDTVDCFKTTPIFAPIYYKGEKVTQDKLTDTLEFLIELGLDVNVRDEDNDTPIIACFHRETHNVNNAKLLIKAGSDVNVENEYSDTPLCLAITNDNVDSVKFLLDNGADINHRNKKGNTFVDYIRSVEMCDLLEKYVHLMTDTNYDEFQSKCLRQYVTN